MNDKVAIQPKVSIEVAESEFERFVDEMDLDLDTSKMDTEDLAGFEKMKRRILRAMTRGALIINENGEPVFTPQRPASGYKEAITFHERTGASIMAMDGKKKGHDAARMYAMMADMCKVAPGTFAKIVGEDIKVCEAIFTLLMD